MDRPKLLLFDIDGTLLDSAGAGLTALQAGLLDAFQLHHLAHRMPALDLAGTTDSAVVRTLFAAYEITDTPENRAQYYSHYSRHLSDNLAHATHTGRALPGVAELLEYLRTQTPHVLALLTGNTEDGARTKLARYRLDHYFAFGAYGHEREHRDELGHLALDRARATTGQAIEATDAIIIGDTPKDIACARAAGFHCIAVATGRFSADELNAYQPDAVLPALTPLQAFLETMARLPAGARPASALSK